MEIFEKIYSKHQRAALIAIFIISIIAYGLVGYAIGRHARIAANVPEIKFIPDINPGVCAVDIDEASDYALRGHIGKKYVRIRYKGRIIVPDKSGKFTIQY